MGESLLISPSNPEISVIVPCFNEAENVVILTKRLEKSLASLNRDFEIIFVDDGSTDETWKIIQQIADANRRVVCLRALENGGLFKSWKLGVSSASGSVCVLIDADLQNPPETVPDLIRELERSNADICQGVRSSISWNRDLRFWSSRGLNTLLNLVFFDRASDHKSGFLAAWTPVLKSVLDYGERLRFPQTFVRASARSRGFLVKEFETLFEPRLNGESFLVGRRLALAYIGVIADFPRAWFQLKSKKVRHRITRDFSANLASPPEQSDRGLRYEFYFKSMPAHAWLISGATTREALETLEQTQFLPREELRTIQSARLQRLIHHAVEGTSYYRELLSSTGLSISDFKNLDDLVHFPLLSKDDVKQNLHMRMFAEGHRKEQMLKIQTSGSTGTPSVTYADKSQLEVRFATTIRALRWTGWRFGDPQLRLWHQRLGMTKSQWIREAIDAKLLRRYFVPAFEMTTASLEGLVKEIDKVRPVLIDGYAESLNFIALFLNQGGSLKAAPKAFMSSAQILTSGTRNLLESTTGAKVFDKYGAREFSGIAYQCGYGQNYHVMDESYVVEVLKDGQPAQPGEVGEVVITDLNNYSTPMIRYRIGDLARAVGNQEVCECGRTLSLIGEIQGRTQALVHCANGRWLPGTFFAHFFKDYEGRVSQFQVIQKTKGEMKLLIVKNEGWTETSWSAIIEHLRDYVGETGIEVEFVENIPLLKTGKRTPVISEVRIDFQSV